jgi:hypothetical protein
MLYFPLHSPENFNRIDDRFFSQTLQKPADCRRAAYELRAQPAFEK